MVAHSAGEPTIVPFPFSGLSRFKLQSAMRIAEAGFGEGGPMSHHEQAINKAIQKVILLDVVDVAFGRLLNRRLYSS